MTPLKNPLVKKTEASTTPYDGLGGEPGIRRLVQRFYALMDDLQEAYRVRQMHPDSLQGSAQSLFEFLSGWLGGPALYVAKNGHPRLRMRLLEAFSQMTSHLLNTNEPRDCTVMGLQPLQEAGAP